MNTASEPFEAASQDHRGRFPIRFSAGLVVIVLLIALATVVTAGVLLSRKPSDDAGGQARTTVAALRADPDGWDSRPVVLQGAVEDVRTIPYLDQYALYTFRDETGSMRVLSRNGAPPESDGVELQAIFHSRVKLDSAVKTIIEEELGLLAGAVVESVLPGIPLDVVYLEHGSYSQAER